MLCTMTKMLLALKPARTSVNQSVSDWVLPSNKGQVGYNLLILLDLHERR